MRIGLTKPYCSLPPNSCLTLNLQTARGQGAAVSNRRTEAVRSCHFTVKMTPSPNPEFKPPEAKERRFPTAE